MATIGGAPFTSQAAQLFRAAQEAAEAAGNPQITPAHVLAAFCNKAAAEGYLQTLAARLGGDIAGLRSKVAARLSGLAKQSEWPAA